MLMLAAFALGAHCQPVPSDDDDADAGSLREQCQAACDRFADEGCEAAQPTPEGVSCVDLCLNVEDQGTLTLDPVCIANADVGGAAGASNRCFAIEDACAE